ncbi:hypothetical protein URH17368_2566 [Alicyclobacillus hesperidum URH17-3-68]|uniref:Uncharacterized protein n=1 Tax=Alicyclobacillus hesperidum TaxID=89784 RepID=A0A1H2W113_9BACL|nr:hypothetical protein [Alicyclobacillus hesperidum]EJY54793.1 hypothetical protein URH17368_2566 [Alicyclobacillus hesperidum URH17-3-68]GLV14852.1 hypothetical protein Heshes_25360 [Alicyclobacillus hesperidum]SDW74211.1 hypothetical protein SAMN04489725_11321 [Alicyclobacillus hesperidum]
MIWLSLVASLSMVVIDWSSLRTAKRREVVLYIGLIGISFGMAVGYEMHLFSKVHLLAPIDALFRPPTKWLYHIL